MTIPVLLNDSQKQASQEIVNDQRGGYRLLYGDVGSGKTNVMIQVAKQCKLDDRKNSTHTPVVILCPTVTIAKQHKNNFEQTLGVTHGIALITQNNQQWKDTFRKDGNRKCRVVIGTHALAYPRTQQCLDDMCIMPRKSNIILFVDEHQKFGKNIIQQVRATWDCKVTVLTSATPMPNALGRNVAGQLPITHIENRQEDKARTTFVHHTPRNWEEAEEIVIKQSRIFRHRNKKTLLLIVVPAIHCKRGDMCDVGRVLHWLIDKDKGNINPNRVGIVHGGMTEEDSTKEIQRTRKGTTKILITTTALETGVHFPNAECIIICDAERFGVAQLYQLQGRVGRDKSVCKQSSCILINRGETKQTTTAFKKLAGRDHLKERGMLMAIMDASKRGPGKISDTEDLTGTIKQHGFTYSSHNANKEIPKTWRNSKRTKRKRINQRQTEENKYFLGTLNSEKKQQTRKRKRGRNLQRPPIKQKQKQKLQKTKTKSKS